jgi:hypothetical protein
MAVALVLVALASGCAHAAEAAHPATGARSSPAPAPSRERLPAGYAGGACQLLDYDVIEAAVGTRFDVGASSQSENTFTCVLQPLGAGYPDLTLSITATDLEPAAFKATVAPKGSVSVPKLGRVAYSAVVPAGAGAGPAVVVGWLSANARLLTLRYRFPADTAAGVPATFTPKLIGLAKQVDSSSI